MGPYTEVETQKRESPLVPPPFVPSPCPRTPSHPAWKAHNPGDWQTCRLAELPLGHVELVLPWCHHSASGNGLPLALEALYGALCNKGVCDVGGTLISLALCLIGSGPRSILLPGRPGSQIMSSGLKPPAALHGTTASTTPTLISALRLIIHDFACYSEMATSCDSEHLLHKKAIYFP